MSRRFRPCEYQRPRELHEAAGLLSSYGEKAKIIAGGTDLLVQKPAGVECLIDLSNLNLNFIHREKDRVVIGALTILNDIECSPVLLSGPQRIIAEAASVLATPTIRNRATIGGNLCNASPAADLPPALMALDATVKIVGLNGSRVLPVADFFRGVNKTDLGAEEFLEEVSIPEGPVNAGASFQKLRHHQTSIDIAIVNAAAMLTCEREICTEARIALGAVAETPIYAREAEALIMGKKIDSEIIQKAAEIASGEAKPIDDIRASAGYRKRVVAVVVKRALEESAKRCGLWQR